MWIPTPIYERIPQFWFLLGLLFIANGLYIGLDMAIAFGYAAIGFSCCAYGIALAIARMKYRRKRSESTEPAVAAE